MVPPPVTLHNGGNGLTVMVTVPVIVFTQPVVALVAITVYTPAVVCIPKSSALPVPGTGVPEITPPTYN